MPGRSALNVDRVPADMGAVGLPADLGIPRGCANARIDVKGNPAIVRASSSIATSFESGSIPSARPNSARLKCLTRCQLVTKTASPPQWSLVRNTGASIPLPD